MEPDARKYQCESCGGPGVYGAEELLLHLEIAGSRHASAASAISQQDQQRGLS